MEQPLHTEEETQQRYRSSESVIPFPGGSDQITKYILRVPGTEITRKEDNERDFTFNNIEFYMNFMGNNQLYLKSNAKDMLYDGKKYTTNFNSDDSRALYDFLKTYCKVNVDVTENKDNISNTKLLSDDDTDKKYSISESKINSFVGLNSNFTKYILRVPGTEITGKYDAKRDFIYNGVEYRVIMKMGCSKVELYLKSNLDIILFTDDECTSNYRSENLHRFLRSRIHVITATPIILKEHEFITDQLCDNRKQKLKDDIAQLYTKYVFDSFVIGQELLNIKSSKILSVDPDNDIKFEYDKYLFRMKFNGNSKTLFNMKLCHDRQFFTFSNLAKLESILVWRVNMITIRKKMNVVFTEDIIDSDGYGGYREMAKLAEQFNTLMKNIPESG